MSSDAEPPPQEQNPPIAGGQNYPPPYIGPQGGAGYGPGYGPGYGTYNGPTLGAPVPAGLGGLPRKWVNVTTRPGVASFATELPTANWRDIWISLIGLAVLTAVTGAIVSLYAPTIISVPNVGGTGVTTVKIGSTSSWGSLVGVPLGFFIVNGILFLVAKLFGGTGTFLQQSYATALFYVPLQGVIALLGLIPFLGGVAEFVLGIYSIVLAVFAIGASHRLTLGKSTAVVLLPGVVLLVVACALLVALAASIASVVDRASY